MTPLPKRRHSTRRQGKRRAALSVVIPKFMKCANCGTLRLPHRMCQECGWYNGKIVLPKKVKKAKK